MEEAIVSFALNQIRDLLANEGRLLLGVGDEVRALETQMKEIKCLLRDADAKRHQNETIFNWLTEIRDLTYSAEVVIETYAARVLSRRSLRQAVIKYCCIMRECYSRHQVGSEIIQIKSELARVMESMRAFGIKSIIDGDLSSTSSNQRQTYQHFEIGDCFVGMKKEMKQLESLLVEDKETRVISIWAMGGSGKTTIARNIYNQMKQTRTNGCFDCFAWVCITQECRIRSVLEDILNQLISQKNENVFTNLTDTQLMERLCEIQRDKRCLVVLDDLWKLSHWNELKHAFLVHDLQTKILITTRRQDVADIGFSMELGILKMEEAWELLKKKANIPDFALEECVEKIGKELVHKCGYLPLAVSVVGGVLKKKNPQEWEIVNKNMNTFVYRNEEEIYEVLNLSYEDLPFYLKPCFLYMGMFKEDESIDVDILYRMWITQGMVSYENIEDNEQSLMGIAELYLTELASRSIVQVEYLDDVALTGKYWTCKLHDVIRELCFKMGKKEQFGLQNLEYGGQEFFSLRRYSSHMKVRYLSISFQGESKVQKEDLTITSGEDICKNLRSVYMINRVGSSVIEFPPQSVVDFHKLISLKELNIRGFKFVGRKLPREITNLIHLRCLNLQECEFDEVPPSISDLVYLEILDLYKSKNVQVPNVFKRMFRLKHLTLPTYEMNNIGNHRLVLEEGIDELESLYDLDSRVHEVKCLGRMKNLISFSARIYDNESLSSIMNVIATIWNEVVYCEVEIKVGCQLGTSVEERLLRNKLFTCPNLRHLIISDVKLGNMVADCQRSELMCSNLTILNMSGCEIEDDPMGILGKLPSLTKLYLWSKSFVGEEMTCLTLSFPRLKTLEFYKLPKLREWRVEERAMPLLSFLEISYSHCLEMIPDGLSQIHTLHKLHIYGMPEMGKRVSSPSGEDHHKVSHIPEILIYD